MKRTLTVGLVFALVLALIAATALAITLLTPRQIVEEHGIPIASQSEGDAYSVEETNILLELARENGIKFTENGMAHINRFLNKGEGYYKQELLVELAMAEFGQDRTAWTLEQQKWFDDVCVAIGFIDLPQKAMPSENEITQEQAFKIAEDYIHTQYDSSVNLNDAIVYKKIVQYLDGNADGAYPGHYWTIIYKKQIVDAAGYTIYINSRGEVWDTFVSPGYIEGSIVDQIYFDFISVLPSDFGAWSHKELLFFQEAVMKSSSINDPAILCLRQTSYPEISPDAMGADEANMIAVKALGLNEDAFRGAVYIDDLPNPVWRVRLFTTNPPYSYPCSYVEVDSITGEVKAIFHPPEGNVWYYAIVLQEVIDEVESTWADTRESVG